MAPGMQNRAELCLAVSAGSKVIYGGATGGGSLSQHAQSFGDAGAQSGGSACFLRSDELYLLDIRNEDVGPPGREVLSATDLPQTAQESSQWMSVPVMGTTPGRRYGQKPQYFLAVLYAAHGRAHHVYTPRPHHDFQQAAAHRVRREQWPAGLR